jgi:hypothetical protein
MHNCSIIVKLDIINRILSLKIFSQLKIILQDLINFLSKDKSYRNSDHEKKKNSNKSCKYKKIIL